MTTRRLTAFLGAIALSCLGQAAVAAPRDPSGSWLTEDGRARVRVEKCGPAREHLCGYVVWLRANPSATDRKNPDARKATRPVLGHQLMLGLRPNSDGRYEGLIYNADDGKSYDVTVWLERPGDLKVKGCLVAFLCSTQNWTPAGDVQPGQLAGATGAPGGPRAGPGVGDEIDGLHVSGAVVPAPRGLCPALIRG